jgi:hypothetical protein
MDNNDQIGENFVIHECMLQNMPRKAPGVISGRKQPKGTKGESFDTMHAIPTPAYILANKRRVKSVGISGAIPYETRGKE